MSGYCIPNAYTIYTHFGPHTWCTWLHRQTHQQTTGCFLLALLFCEWGCFENQPDFLKIDRRDAQPIVRGRRKWSWFTYPVCKDVENHEAFGVYHCSLFILPGDSVEVSCHSTHAGTSQFWKLESSKYTKNAIWTDREWWFLRSNAWTYT